MPRVVEMIRDRLTGAGEIGPRVTDAWRETNSALPIPDAREPYELEAVPGGTLESAAGCPG